MESGAFLTITFELERQFRQLPPFGKRKKLIGISRIPLWSGKDAIFVVCIVPSTKG